MASASAGRSSSVRTYPPEPLSTLTTHFALFYDVLYCQVSSQVWVMRQMLYSGTTSSSAKPAGPSMCPPHHPHRHTIASHTHSLRTPFSTYCYFSRIPWWLTQRMVLNLAIATSVGLVPFVGDVLLAAFRANSRNAALLEEFLRLRGEGVMRTVGGESSTTGARPPADEGIGVRGAELRTVHEAAGQDIDDGGMPPLQSKRSWLSRQGTPDVDDKRASTSALPDGPQVVRHRDSRFIEDVS